MTDMKPKVFIVEDDIDLLKAIEFTLSANQFRFQSFQSGEAFLSHLESPLSGLNEPAVVLLDIRLSGISGLQVFDRLDTLTFDASVVFMTGHGDIEMAVDVMKQGAYDFVTKPFKTTDLMKKIEVGYAQSVQRVDRRNQMLDIQAKLDQLTPKEREVVQWIAAGETNKTISDRLGNSVRTVELHRARIFEKMGVQNAVELTKVLTRLDQQ